MESSKQPGLIRVVESITRPPLLETQDARIIEFYDGVGELMALVVKGVLADPSSEESCYWGFCARGYPDWDECLIRYGYREGSPDEIIKILNGKKM